MDEINRNLTDSTPLMGIAIHTNLALTLTQTRHRHQRAYL